MAVSSDAEKQRRPGPGDQAPDFELPDQDGESVRLSELRGQPVVLYFYPKAGAAVLGASPDPVAAVKRFHDKQGLNFRLLADEDHAVTDSYGVWVEKSMYGKTYWGAQRATFIIDPEGTVAGVIPKASPKTHDEQVLKILGSL